MERGRFIMQEYSHSKPISGKSTSDYHIKEKSP